MHVHLRDTDLLEIDWILMMQLFCIEHVQTAEIIIHSYLSITVPIVHRHN